MKTIEAPRTAEQFVRSGWVKKVATLVTGYHLNEDVEDTVADIVASMVEKSYIERWEPGLGSFSNWIYTFAGNFCKKRFTKSRTKGGKLIERAARIETSIGKDEGQKGVVLEEHIPSHSFDGDSMIFASEMLEIIKEHQTEAFSYVLYDESGFTVVRKDGRENRVESNEVPSELIGLAFKRDWETIYTLLLEGFNTDEIRSILQTSIQFVQSQFRGIKKLAADVAF